MNIGLGQASKEAGRFRSGWIASTVLACVALSGCSITGFGGGSSLSCGLPDGVRCDSVSNTYTQSSRGELPGQTKGLFGSKSPGVSREQALHEGTRSLGAPAVAESIAPALHRTSPSAMPIRSQARVLRVWIKPWEDSDGDLHDQSFVYLPLEEGRWLLDRKQREIREAYAPVRPSNALSSTNAPSPRVAVGSGGNVVSTSMTVQPGSAISKLEAQRDSGDAARIAETIRRSAEKARADERASSAGTSAGAPGGK